MTFTRVRTLALISVVCLTACLLSYAQCPVNSIAIKGRVEHPPRNASVRVVLVYPPDRHAKNSPTGIENKERPGESAEAILAGDAFTIPVEFLTNDSRTEMTFKSRCTRQPQTIVVTLKGKDTSGSNEGEAYDRVTLDFPRQFKSDDSRHYTLRSDLVLNRQ